jgi:hypothetical protein
MERLRRSYGEGVDSWGLRKELAAELNGSLGGKVTELHQNTTSRAIYRTTTSLVHLPEDSR